MPRFKNPDPAHRFHTFGAVWRWGVWDRLTGRRRRVPPGPPAPAVPADLELVRHRDDAVRLTWIGHASFLGLLGGRRFLIDPVFSSRVGVFYPRYGRPGLRPEEVPEVDVVAVTHAHYDHLDAPFIRRLPRSTPVVSPLGLGRWFRRRGFTEVHELDRWQSIDAGGLRLTLTPARHWAKRGLFDTNRTLWGGYVVEGGESSIYHAGDSGFYDGLAEVGERFPGLAAALLPIGAYDPPWFMEPHHMNPEQAGRLFLELGARRFVPMHWGTYKLTDEPLLEPVERLRSWWQENDPGDGRTLDVLAVGETLTVRPET